MAHRHTFDDGSWVDLRTNAEVTMREEQACRRLGSKHMAWLEPIEALGYDGDKNEGIEHYVAALDRWVEEHPEDQRTPWERYQAQVAWTYTEGWSVQIPHDEAHALDIPKQMFAAVFEHASKMMRGEDFTVDGAFVDGVADPKVPTGESTDSDSSSEAS